MLKILKDTLANVYPHPSYTRSNVTTQGSVPKSSQSEKGSFVTIHPPLNEEFLREYAFRRNILQGEEEYLRQQVGVWWAGGALREKHHSAEKSLNNS